jgi:DNA repair protein RecO (recombination protein O)
VAKGARRSTSRLVGHLEPLTQLQASFSHGRNFDYINQAQVVGSFPHLKSDLTAVSNGVYVAELLEGFGQESSPSQQLYSLALETLRCIDQHLDSPWPLRYFELHLLRVSGFMPELYQCVECRKTLAPGQHRFSPAVGGTLCLDCRPEGGQVRPLSLRALKVLRLLDRGQLPDIVLIKLTPPLANEIESLTGSAVKYWLEREIRSKSFVEQLRSESNREVYT